MKIIKILIIDDDAAFIESIRLILEEEEYIVETAEDGRGALELLKEQKDFSIVLCDYKLPDMSGIDLIKQILQISSDIVPVLISGTSSMDLALEGMRSGVHDYLVKPIDFDELRKVIQNIIKEIKDIEKGKEKLKEIVGSDRADPIKQIEVQEAIREVEPAGPAVLESYDKKDKTVFDFVLDRASKYHKGIKKFAVFFLIVGIGFLAIDTFLLQLTGLGKKLHVRILPPAIILNSIPTGAQVSLKDKDGIELVGENKYTPVVIPKIMDGIYSLRMNRKGFKPIEYRITVHAEKKKIKDISISGNVKKIEGKRTQEFIIPFELPVTIDSEPAGAAVYIDGKKMGDVTPVSIDLTAGFHSVMLEKEGFPPLGNMERIEIYGQCNLDLLVKQQSGIDRRYWEIKFKEEGAYLKGTFWKEVTVDSIPSEIQFFVDDVLIGATPLKVRLKVGEHSARAEKTGFTEWSKTIRIPEDDEIVISLSKPIRFIAYDKDNPGKDIAAKVWVSGTKIRGRTTPFSYNLKPQTYKMTFKKFPDFTTWGKNINVAKKEKMIVYMKRTKVPVKIEVVDKDTELPVDIATIIIDDYTVGATNEYGFWSGNISRSGNRLLKIRKDGYKEKTAEYYFSLSKKDRKIKIHLEPLQPTIFEVEETILVIDTRANFPGAMIFLNGKYKGKTIRKISNISLGTYEITIKHPHIGEITNKIEITELGRRVIVEFDSDGKMEVNIR